MSTPPSPKARRTISKEFKPDAVRLAASVGIRRAAADLGVGESALYAWRKSSQKDGGDAFRGHGNRTEAEAELTRLRREVAVLKMEREILKKAAEFWVKERA